MKSVKFYFDKAVNTYEIAGKIQKKVAQSLVNMIEPIYYPTVIEIGSGKGFLTKSLIEKIKYKKYINVDLSFLLIKKLKEKLGNKTLYLNTSAENLPLRYNCANLIVSSSSLHWLNNIEMSFCNIFNLLKEGGKFYFSIFVDNSLNEIKISSRESGFGSCYPLPKSEIYLNTLNSLHNVKYNLEIKNYREKFPNVRELLLSLKLTGTNFTYNKKFSGKNSFKKFCKIYEELFSDNDGVYCTYEVLFIEGQKLSLSHQG